MWTRCSLWRAWNLFIEKIKENSETEEIFPEHEFVASCLRVGLTISDLKELSYIDVMKILFTFINTKNVKEKNATQSDIDRLLG